MHTWIHDGESVVILQSVSKLVVFEGFRDTHNILIAWKDGAGTIRSRNIFGGRYIAPSSVEIALEQDGIVGSFKIIVSPATWEPCKVWIPPGLPR